MKNLPLNASHICTEQATVYQKNGKNSIAIFNSNDELPTNGDAIYKFKQNSDLYWLSGITRKIHGDSISG